MYVNSEQALDSVFLSYDKILKKLHLLGLTTKQGKEITELDLRKAIKKKYLELLEKYKMELTELYIKEVYIYNEFFGRN